MGALALAQIVQGQRAGHLERAAPRDAIFLLDQGRDSSGLLQRSPVGRVALPEPAHVATHVPGDAFVVLEARIPTEAPVAEDPDRRSGGAVVVLVVFVVKVIVIVHHVVEIKVVSRHGCLGSLTFLAQSTRMVNTRARPGKIFPTFSKSLLLPCQRVF